MTAMPEPRSMVSARATFSAFVSDDPSTNALYHLCSEFGWASDTIYGGGLQNAIQTLAVSASPSILFVDLSHTQNPLVDINALAEVCEPGTMVIACGHLNDVRLYRELLASGIQDYLLKPLQLDQLRDAFVHAQALLSEAKTGSSAPEKNPVSLGILGVRGGCGATSFATSLAWSLATNQGRLTALLDLDLHFGTGALQLDLEPGRGLTEAIENPTRIDGLFLERSMIKAGDRLSVLSAEAPLLEPVISDGTGFLALQQEVISSFECTVVDLPRGLVLYQPQLIDMLGHLILVSELTLASARDCCRLLAWLKSVAPHVQPLVVANKAGSGSASEISRGEFEKAIERQVDLVSPDDPKTARQAAKLGKPLTAANPNSRLATGIETLAGKLAFAETTASVASAPVSQTSSGTSGLRGVLQKLVGRRGMVTG